MKKMMTVLLILLMLAACAQAEETMTVYDVLAGLIGGRQFTLTVTAEGTEGLEDIVSDYGTVVCDLRREDEKILLDVTCDGNACLNVCAEAEKVKFDTDLIAFGSFESEWAALEPNVSVDDHQISITMTGPDHELISFSCKVTGSDPADCRVEIRAGFITGPGNVYSLWDGITNTDNETSYEFYFSFSEEEYVIEGEGTNTVGSTDDGGIFLNREEECIVTVNEDEIGTLTIRSTLTIH